MILFWLDSLFYLNWVITFSPYYWYPYLFFLVRPCMYIVNPLPPPLHYTILTVILWRIFSCYDCILYPHIYCSIYCSGDCSFAATEISPNCCHYSCRAEAVFTARAFRNYTAGNSRIFPVVSLASTPLPLEPQPNASPYLSLSIPFLYVARKES